MELSWEESKLDGSGLGRLEGGPISEGRGGGDSSEGEERTSSGRKRKETMGVSTKRLALRASEKRSFGGNAKAQTLEGCPNGEGKTFTKKKARLSYQEFKDPGKV